MTWLSTLEGHSDVEDEEKRADGQLNSKALTQGSGCQQINLIFDMICQRKLKKAKEGSSWKVVLQNI